MILKVDKNILRHKRHARLRNLIHGTATRPRLNVFRSLAHIYVQIIDDDKGLTLTAASSLEKGLLNIVGEIYAAKILGSVIAKKALDKGITEVVLDCDEIYLLRSPLRHLLVAAREAGLKF